MPRRLALAALALVVVLGACRSVPQSASPGSTVDQRAALGGLSDWQARGRVAVRSASDGFSASFNWQEAAGQSSIDVHGPFGAGAAHISRSRELILIDTGNGAPLQVPPPFTALEPALTAQLGFPLPIDLLRYWVLGVPAPSAPSESLAGGFRQAGWQVFFSAFTTVAGAPGPLPIRFALSRGLTEIRVAISTWQVGGP